MEFFEMSEKQIQRIAKCEFYKLEILTTVYGFRFFLKFRKFPPKLLTFLQNLQGIPSNRKSV